MRKQRVTSKADYQPAASQSNQSNNHKSNVSLTLASHPTAQAKRVGSLQENPAQFAIKSRAQALQQKLKSTRNEQSENAVQRMEEEELQGKFESTQLMEEEELQLKSSKNGQSEIAVQRVEEEELQGKFESAQLMEEEELMQGKAKDTGMPNQLKSGIESLSGISMDDVKVHYNSDKPAQLNALAYAQGNDIHLGSGQEQHLPHEAWHVVQQAQGRVKPTVETASGTKINDDAGLENEADVMGAKAAQLMPASGSKKSKNKATS
jgi:hypothetical protein